MNRLEDRGQWGGFTFRSPFSVLRSSNHGFTLVEATIAATILSVTMLIAALAFTTIVHLQQKAATVRQVQQNTRYILETISRDVRNATDYNLVSAQELHLPNSLRPNEQLRYMYDSGQVYRLRCVSGSCGDASVDGDSLGGGQIHVMDLRMSQVPSTTTADVRPIRIYIKTRQLAPGLTEESPYYYEYETTALVVPRR